MTDRYLWGDADLVPTDKAGKDALANRTMNQFLRTATKRHTPQPGTPRPGEGRA